MHSNRTIIELDVDLEWLLPPIAYSVGQSRIYAVAPEPLHVLLVVHDKMSEQMDMIPSNLYYDTTSRRYQCSIGEHDGAAYPDYVNPSCAGYKHLKISVREQVDPDTPVTHRLSELLDAAPRTGDSIGTRADYKGIHVDALLPPEVHRMATEVAHLHFGESHMNMSDLIAEALLQGAGSCKGRFQLRNLLRISIGSSGWIPQAVNNSRNFRLYRKDTP